MVNSVVLQYSGLEFLTKAKPLKARPTVAYCKAKATTKFGLKAKD